MAGRDEEDWRAEMGGGLLSQDCDDLNFSNKPAGSLTGAGGSAITSHQLN